MARPISWLPRLAAIRKAVGGTKRTHYDSAAIGDLFQMQPRAAAKLMALLPQVSALGRSHLVERGALARFLDDVHAADDPAALCAGLRMRRRVASRRRPRVLVRRDEDPVTVATLPATVKLERCRMTVEFETRQQLAEAMYNVAQVLEADEFESRFCIQIEKPAEDPAKAEVKALIERNDEAFEVWIKSKNWRNPDPEKDTMEGASSDAAYLLDGNRMVSNPSLSASSKSHDQ